MAAVRDRRASRRGHLLATRSRWRADATPSHPLWIEDQIAAIAGPSRHTPKPILVRHTQRDRRSRGAAEIHGGDRFPLLTMLARNEPIRLHVRDSTAQPQVDDGVRVLLDGRYCP